MGKGLGGGGMLLRKGLVEVCNCSRRGVYQIQVAGWQQLGLSCFNKK